MSGAPSTPNPSISSAGASGTPQEGVLEAILSGLSARFTPAEGAAAVCVSFGLLVGHLAFPIDVEVPRLAELLNEVGDATVAAQLADVQFWLQRRTCKDGLPDAIYGVAVDVDIATTDVLSEIERAGVPMPAAYFNTAGGYKPVFVFDAPVDAAAFEQSARRLTLAFEGGDPASWTTTQGQRLPKCLKCDDMNVVLVDFVAHAANPVPLQGDVSAVPFPVRVLRALGGWRPTAADRARVREYLDDNGISAPESAGSTLYDACPVCNGHDSRCCYVNMREDGSIDVTCLGGHDGEGKKRWSERDLLHLAGEATAAMVASFDPLRDMPVTWAARALFECRLASWDAPLREAAFSAWMLEKAMREAPNPAAASEMMNTYERRLRGDPAFGAVQMYLSQVEQRLAFHDAAGRRYFVNCKETGPNTKSNLHECQSTAAWTLVEKEREGGIDLVPGWAPTTSSLLNKAHVGQRSALRVLGIPAITRYDLPVAHVSDGWDVEPRTKVITATKAFVFPEGTVEVPALNFFLDLYRAGRLPLASENDVRLLVACIAAPLLRDIGRGQLGIFWFIGPPGSGKDFLAEMAAAIWGSVTPQPLRVSFDVNVTNDLEMKRSFAAAEGAVYGRAKEAGKRLGILETLVQIAGTNSLTARGMRENERSIPNSFVIVADSAEDLPDRREISRRTVMISVADMDDRISKGEVLEEVKRAAPGLLLNLKRLIETQPPAWYLGQTDTKSRLLVPVALSRLLGATLQEVQGQDLSDIFEAMKDFSEMPIAKEEGERERCKAQDRGTKESLDMRKLPSYRLSFFIDQMKGVAGCKELFASFGRTVAMRIMRESAYADVRNSRKPYLSVQLGSSEYAFKLVRGSRNFILVPASDYEQLVLGHAAPPVASPVPGEPESAAGVTDEPCDPAAAQRPDTEPLSFGDNDLLEDGETR